MRAALLLLAAVPVCSVAADSPWVNLLASKDLSAWEVIGDGLWSIMRDGTLLGQRSLDKTKAQHQAWVYTKKDYGEFDLQLEYWTRTGGNSGVSIRDTSRAHWAVPPNWDQQKTPSHIGYEIQISNGYKDKYPSGSVYLFDVAKDGVQIPNDWNTLEIRSRNDSIQVLINGTLVSKHAGDPARSKTGPIGLQLHDASSIVMFRHIRLREIKK